MHSDGGIITKELEQDCKKSLKKQQNQQGIFQRSWVKDLLGACVTYQ